MNGFHPITPGNSDTQEKSAEDNWELFPGQPDNDSVMSPDSQVSGSSKTSSRRLSIVKTEEGKKAIEINQDLCGRRLAVVLGMRRVRHFNLLALVVLVCGGAWLVARCMMSIQGEKNISLQTWGQLAGNIGNSIETRLQQDMVYQDSIANIWTTFPNISRDSFHDLVMSETYAPGLVSMSGMSLIVRVRGEDERRQLEKDTQSEALRQQCCAGSNSTGSSCKDVAATGLFCRGSSPQYRITQFGNDGQLVPAIGNSIEYINRVGEEEYMVVHMIEPFHSNAKVWGFNLLSSDARLAAWRTAQRTGKKTFTRRLNLVQSSGGEFGFLVWLPIFERSSHGKWTTAMTSASVAESYNAVGSVNGVYRAQVLLDKALESIFSKEGLDGVSVYLFDDAPELQGSAQYLASHNAPVDNPFEHYKDMSIGDVEDNCELLRKRTVEIPEADVKWVVIACGDETYLSARRTIYPELTAAMGFVFLVISSMDRCLGHPTVMKSAFSEIDKRSIDYDVEAQKTSNVGKVTLQ